MCVPLLVTTYVHAILFKKSDVLYLLPPLFFRGGSSGLGNGLAAFTGGGSKSISIFFWTSSLRAVANKHNEIILVHSYCISQAPAN